MTTIILVTIAFAVGLFSGRLHSFHRHVEHDFAAWRDRITASAILPAPILDLEAVEVVQ